MLVRQYLKADGARPLHIDDHALNHRDYLVAWQRILPCLQHRMSHFGLDEIHLADIPLILLEGSNAL